MRKTVLSSNISAIEEKLKARKPIKKFKAANYNLSADLYKDENGYYVVYPFDHFRIILPKNAWNGNRYKTEDQAFKALVSELNTI
jgi:hypothetical protein